LPRLERQRRRGEAGFTLVELLVTLVVLGLFLSLLFGGLRFGTRVWEATGAAGERRDAMEAAHGFLRRALAEARPSLGLDGEGQPLAAFQGGAEALVFLAPLPAHLSLGGDVVVRVALAGERDRLRLVARWSLRWPRPADPAAPEGEPREVVLAEGLRAAAFAYYGRLAGEEVPAWHDAWDEATNALPELVRLRVLGGNGAAWPDLVVALRLAGTGGSQI
jgi:general secretion pathway protein J